MLTAPANISIVCTMKLKAIIVLMALCLSIALPPSLTLMASHDGRAAIVTLDVCHAASSALSSNGEMPCVNEGTYNSILLTESLSIEVSNPPCKPFFIAFQDEHPPKS